MSAATYLVGDVFDVMGKLEDRSVDLVLTSPPFLALRSYLPDDHPDKAKEIGSEPTPAEFIDTLLALTAEWGRLITDTGSIAVELGDTYAGSGGSGGDYDTGKMRGDQAKFKGSALADRKNKVLNASGQRMQQGNGWPQDKSMCLIPHLYAASLSYGRNILTGEPSPAGSWRVRNVIAWCRPNPAVGALGDKVRPATSFMVIACKARDRWFDLDAVRSDHKTADAITRPRATYRRAHDDDGVSTNTGGNPAGAPPLDHVGLREGEADLFTDDAWLVSTEGYKGSHYATWPRNLLDQPILTMCPREVCTKCGEPRRRITGEPTYVRTDSDTVPARLTMLDGERPADGVNQHTRSDGANTSVTRSVETLGWTDCGCGAPFRRGHVLDPFGGSGTTAVVATAHGRDCTLIDLDERNVDLARDRVGMFLTVPEPDAVA
jgi:hypothetical protein